MLHLRRGDEKTVMRIDLSPLKMVSMKTTEQLRHYMREGWALVDAEGSNRKAVDFVKKQIASYEVDPDGYKIPIRETVSVGASVAGATVGDVKRGAKKVLKARLKRVFKRGNK